MKMKEKKRVPAWIMPERVSKSRELISSGCQLTLELKRSLSLKRFIS